MFIFSIFVFPIVLASMMSFSFWQSSLTPVITQNFSAEKKKQYDDLFGKASFISLGVCVVLLILFGSLFYLNIWNLMFYAICLFFIVFFAQNIRSGVTLLNLDFFQSRVGNYIVSEILLPYLFVFSWIKLLIVFVTGNP